MSDYEMIQGIVGLVQSKVDASSLPHNPRPFEVNGYQKPGRNLTAILQDPKSATEISVELFENATTEYLREDQQAAQRSSNLADHPDEIVYTMAGIGYLSFRQNHQSRLRQFLQMIKLETSHDNPRKVTQELWTLHRTVPTATSEKTQYYLRIKSVNAEPTEVDGMVVSSKKYELAIGLLTRAALVSLADRQVNLRAMDNNYLSNTTYHQHQSGNRSSFNFMRIIS